MEFPAAYLEFARLCRVGRYYDAHEVLEDLWACEVAPLKDFYKVLIMSAVSLEHFKRGRKEVASRLGRVCLERLECYGVRHEGMDLGRWRVILRGLVAGEGEEGWCLGIACEVEGVDGPCLVGGAIRP